MSLLPVAEAAVAAWGDVAVPPRLIHHRENAVFEVWLTDGRHGALRLHRPGYMSTQAIRSELVWMAGLGERGVPVPEPLETRTGELVETLPDGQVATLIGWVEGAPIGAGDVRLEGRPEDILSLHGQIGATLALLHKVSDTLDLPDDFSRPRWDREAFVGEEPLWGRYWQNPGLTKEDAALVQEARGKAADILDSLAAPDIGLIHADALRENVFRTPSGLTLIDYDDGGFGYRHYDLACAMVQSLGAPEAAAYRTALVEGYRRVRPFSVHDEALLPLFEMLRCFQSLGWCIPRIPADDPRMRTYVDRAVETARQVLLTLA
jgi:Ser/Thr protein kinase RdoA (MazF antagonist)